METLLTPDDVANILKVPKSWIYGHVHQGTLPFAAIKIGHYLRFLESGVKEYLQQQMRQSETKKDKLR